MEPGERDISWRGCRFTNAKRYRARGCFTCTVPIPSSLFFPFPSTLFIFLSWDAHHSAVGPYSWEEGLARSFWGTAFLAFQVCVAVASKHQAAAAVLTPYCMYSFCCTRVRSKSLDIPDQGEALFGVGAEGGSQFPKSCSHLGGTCTNS